MPLPIASYLAGRPEFATFLVTADLARALDEIFPDAEKLLPQPYRIYPADETQPPTLGYPVAESTILRDLDVRLDRWMHEEITLQLNKSQDAKEKAALAFAGYMTQLMKAAENALLSNLLNDYHAIFWLAHSFDVARHFATLPRRIGLIDMQVGRAQGDVLKYRIFSRWASEARDQMTQLAARVAPVLDGEEQRGAQFFRILQEDVLIFTEEFIGPDLRELRSFITGYLRRDFQVFRDTFERLRSTATELLQRDRAFRAAIPMFGTTVEHGITVALLLDPRFQAFLYDNPNVHNAVSREEREQFQLIAKRVREFAVLNQLRRGVIWMTTTAEGEIISTDRRNPTTYSRSTRPLDYNRPGVVDPMVHRFGLIYDISAFSETLGKIRRGGRKEEISSYRQMVLFQRKLEAITERHSLQFEKFLGDGAFYTTRRALRLVRAAVEIQRFYAEMRRKRFAFDKGLRIALNFGYYRLLPMKTRDSSERITEFYGPGIVELSRLTTGKANKEIEDVASLLVAHGYDAHAVEQFFAPLARGVDLTDRSQQQREFYAYINRNRHLINEGIVASMSLVHELSNELALETAQLYRLRAAWGNYIGFAPALTGIEFIGVRLLGGVSLKGLDNVEVAEIAPFRPSEVEAIPLDSTDPLVTLVRVEFHQEEEHPASVDPTTTAEHHVEPEIVICINNVAEGSAEQVLIAEWDPHSDALLRPLRMPLGDFQRLFSIRGALTIDRLASQKASVRELYKRLTEHTVPEPVPLGAFRGIEFDRFVLGDVVEKL